MPSHKTTELMIGQMVAILLCENHLMKDEKIDATDDVPTICGMINITTRHHMYEFFQAVAVDDGHANARPDAVGLKEIHNADNKKSVLPIAVASPAWWSCKTGNTYSKYRIDACLDIATDGSTYVVITPITYSVALHDDTERLTSIIDNIINREVGRFLAGQHEQHIPEWRMTTTPEDEWRRIIALNDRTQIYETISCGLLRGGVVQTELEADLAALRCESTSQLKYLQMLAWQANREGISFADRFELKNRIAWHLDPYAEYYGAPPITHVDEYQTLVTWSLLPDKDFDYDTCVFLKPLP